MGLGRIFDISVRTMSVYQRAIDVSSQNISNANNPDYSRQKVVLTSEITQGDKGTGVKLQDVLRIRDNMLDSQLRKYQSTLSDANRRSEILKQVESIISEPSENGLSTYITEFFNAWDELTTNPNSVQLRLNIIQKAQRMSERFKETMDGFSEIQYSLQSDASVKVEQINSYLKSINELNGRIYESESRGLKASELKDQRDSLIDKLSGLVNITVQMNENGAAVVTVGGVQGADLNSHNQFELKIVNGQMRLVSKLDSNAAAIVNAGEFFAISDLYSNKIPSYKISYENLATSIVNNVNNLHKQGFSLMQAGVSETGIPFFGQLDASGNVVNAIDDGKIRINPAILNNPKFIAASNTANNDGNGLIANMIARLTDSKLPELNDQTLIENYISILNNIGIEKVLSDNRIESSEMVIQQLQTQKMSYSGVSIEEEMTNILKYQRSFDAAAKLIKVADELLETILNMV